MNVVSNSGESEAIVACQEQRADMLQVDDAEARKMAKSFGIRVMGTGGVLVLVSAFAGLDRVFETYREAVAQRYRFFSYGDAMLIR